MDNTKTIWRCTLCGKDGAVDHAENAPMIDVISEIVAQHEVASTVCPQTFDKLQVKMFGA